MKETTGRNRGEDKSRDGKQYGTGREKALRMKEVEVGSPFFSSSKLL